MMRKKDTYSPKNCIQVAFLPIKKYCFYQKLCHFKSSKFATPPHDVTANFSMFIGRI